ncbi:MAG: LEVG family PEP-CTERM protein [Leptolyngbyaceae cyanobacterium bins.59]|nr:LEVG family PEP-CTERM protein [Leptolyngbyaceae cyanobacterium bins.59]
MLKLTALVVALSASTLSLASLAGAASAASLMPTAEGEVNVGFANPLQTGSSYVATSGFKVTSFVDSSTNTKSRLFVDRAGTANTYGPIAFRSNDIGTAEGTQQLWFRPVAMKADGITPRVEQGQLEVGTFKIDFDNVMASLNVRWFDTEDLGTAFKALDVLGNVMSGDITPGGNNNIVTKQFANVKSLILDLGQANSPKFRSTGDGVNFQLSGVPQSVPEPATLTGLALLVGGALMSRRRLAA